MTRPELARREAARTMARQISHWTLLERGRQIERYDSVSDDLLMAPGELARGGALLAEHAFDSVPLTDHYQSAEPGGALAWVAELQAKHPEPAIRLLIGAALIQAELARLCRSGVNVLELVRLRHGGKLSI